jgi:collagenase-like PrtC family protease
MLKTRESDEFLVLNGTQTQSARVYNLVDSLDALRAMGVDAIRLSPQSQNMAAVVAVFDCALRGTFTGTEAMQRLQPLAPAQSCNGYWHGHPGMDLVPVAEAAVH